MKTICGKFRAAVLPFLVLMAHTAVAQVDQTIYSDSLQNGWQSYGWATLNYANTSPVHSGSDSISVSATTNYQALFLHHGAFDTTLYTNLTFWINGGAAGGQSLQVQALLLGTAQSAVFLPPLVANTWQQITLSLASLGVANKPDMDGFWIQERTSFQIPVFYVDDIKLTAAPLPAVTHISLNAGQTVRTVDARQFAINTAVWDSYFNTPNTISLLGQAGVQAMRFPGGSTSDDYHWASNTSGTNTWTWATSFDGFAHVATNLHTQVFITANYGSGTAQEATNWVLYSNVTKKYGFKYWEVGNECYGGWETDTNARPHDPYTYGTRAAAYFTGMKAVDPTIKVGVVVLTGEDSSFVTYTDHPATNPRTGKTHNGWTPVLLTTLKNLGITPDFVIYHRYAQNPGQESDASLLQSSATWPNDAADLRQQLSDYLGAPATNVELTCTENNSVSSGPGKQTTSLVNGLFQADSLGNLMQTEFNSLVWWDLRNGPDASNNNSPSLYGWRQYGDYGIVDNSHGTNNFYPTYYVGKLFKYFARPGDKIIHATADYSALSAFAAKRTNGSVSLLVINKDPPAAINAAVNVSGYAPNSNAVIYSYGMPQDNAAQTGVGSPDIAQTNFAGAGTNFSYTFPPYSVTVFSFAPGPPKLSLPAVRPDGSFQFQLTGEIGAPYVIQISTNLSNWTPVATNMLATNILSWVDPQPTNSPTRFYRAVWMP